MDGKLFDRVFPLGAHLCREPMPALAELKRDMEVLKRNGFNLVKLQEHWMVDEPAEGEYDFSRYEELIEHAGTLDLGVYLGLTCEQAPTWLYEKHPDCRMVGRDGVPIVYQALTTLPADGKPGPCYDHPGAMADQLRFIRRLVEVLGAYENVVVWNTWQEVGYWSDQLVGRHVCYCDNTQAHYRKWLQSVFGDLDALNAKWRTRYADWRYVVPERCAQRLQEVQEQHWRYFMDNVQIGRVLRKRAEAIREADPLGRPVFAHKAGPIIGAGQDWTYARCQDFLGSSCYPPWFCVDAKDDESSRPLGRHASLRTEMWNGVGILYDYIRSCNVRGAPVWAAEFQGGPVSTGFHKGRVPSPEDIRRWMLTAVGSGITALSFWVARAEIMALESNGFSLLDSEGDTTPRLEEAGRIGRALNEHPELFGQPTRPPSDVAIVVDEWNAQFCNNLSQGGQSQSYSVRGWYRFLWDLGIPVDFVEASELGQDYVSGYAALILPFPLSMSEAVAEKLAGYVENGGNLVSEACPGRVDDAGFCNRGELSPRLRDLFGVTHESFTMVREPEGGQRWSPPERSWGEYLEPALLTGEGELDGCRLRANVYIETFQPTDSFPCLRYGKAVAGVTRRVGKGTAWLLGTFVGHSGTAYRSPEIHDGVKKILGACGIVPVHAGKLLLRKRVTEGKEAWLFTNPTEQPVTESIDTRGWRTVTDLLGEEPARNGDRVDLTVGSLDVRALVVSR